MVIIMGYNATVIVMVDALESIKNDPKFGEKLAASISRVSCYQEREDVSAGGYVNAATVIETHHADHTVLVAVGGNYGNVIGTTYGISSHTPEQKLRIIKDIADQLGYNLSKKPTHKK